MATKTFKYGHLWTTGNTAPQSANMIPGEIAVGLNPSATTIWSFDGTEVIDLGAKLGGQGDEKTIHTELVNGVKTFFGLATIQEVTGTTLPSNVAKRYALVDSDGNNIIAHSGDTFAEKESQFIDIYKDSSIVEIYVGTSGDTVDPDSGTITKKQIGESWGGAASGGVVTELDMQFLNYVYYAGGFSGTTSGDGKYYMTQIDLRKFLTEKEFASGVTINTEGIVVGVVDPDTEQVVISYDASGNSASTAAVLTVGEAGFKTSNVQLAIDEKVKTLDAIISGGSESAATIESASTHVFVEIEEEDGKLKEIKVKEIGIADIKEAVVSAVSSAQTVEVVLASEEGAVSGKTYNFETFADIVPMRGYESGVTEDLFGIEATDNVKDAVKKIEDKLYSNGDGVNQDGETNNTGIVFVEGSDEIIKLNAGTF